jgi:hypothetical protein
LQGARVLARGGVSVGHAVVSLRFTELMFSNSRKHQGLMKYADTQAHIMVTMFSA